MKYRKCLVCEVDTDKPHTDVRGFKICSFECFEVWLMKDEMDQLKIVQERLKFMGEVFFHRE